MSLPADFPKDKPILLIIDGDVIAFIAAAACERVVQDELGNVRTEGFIDEGIAVAAGLIAKFRNQLRSGDLPPEYIVVLSDPHDNYRFDIDHNYKGNRKAGDMSRVPVLLNPLKEWLKREHSANFLPRLEADDAVGLLMTDPKLEDFARIAVGRDKDFKCIPGWHYQYHKGDENADITPFYQSPEDADRWHLMQSLAGDMTDGFGGCPGIGLKRAAVLIEECMLQVPGEGVITRGANKGQKVVRWTQTPAANHWECIVSHYEKHGLGEMEALQTARLAHLLRHGEYNPETHEVKLWTPSF
jgi:hypothetical protein